MSPLGGNPIANRCHAVAGELVEQYGAPGESEQHPLARVTHLGSLDSGPINNGGNEVKPGREGLLTRAQRDTIRAPAVSAHAFARCF
jgi:hypothetical protein